MGAPFDIMMTTKSGLSLFYERSFLLCLVEQFVICDIQRFFYRADFP